MGWGKNWYDDRLEPIASKLRPAIDTETDGKDLLSRPVEPITGNAILGDLGD